MKNIANKALERMGKEAADMKKDIENNWDLPRMTPEQRNETVNVLKNIDDIASKQIIDEYEKSVGYGSNSIWKTWKEMEQSFEIKRLEALVLSYCKDHPEAREHFNITSQRKGEI